MRPGAGREPCRGDRPDVGAVRLNGVVEPGAVLMPSASQVDGVLRAVPAWWRHRFAEPFPAALWPEESPSNAAGADVPPGAFDDLSVYDLGEAYIAAVPAADRSKSGRFYTPKGVALALWDEVVKAGVPDRPHVHDPACGTGALLLAAIDALGSDAMSEVVLTGTDTDAAAVWLGNVLLDAHCRHRGAMPAAKPELVAADGLAPRGERPDVVIMNPPFGRAKLTTEERIRWAPSLFGHANLYGLFLHSAIEQVRDGGLVAAVLPTSFIGGAYFQRLRGFVAAEAPLVRLRTIVDRSGLYGGGVLQETCLAVFRKGASADAVELTTQRVNGVVATNGIGAHRVTGADWTRPWFVPRGPEDVAMIHRARAMGTTLRDHGWRVSTGPLVWNRHREQITGDAREDSVPILWAGDVAPGLVRRGSARERQRWIELRERDDFMRFRGPMVLLQRTTSPEQPRRLVSACLTQSQLDAEWGGTVVVENHLNVLRPAGPETSLSPALVARLLATGPYDRLYRCITGSVAVSAYEIESLPLPDRGTLLRWEDLDERELEHAVSEAFA